MGWASYFEDIFTRFVESSHAVEQSIPDDLTNATQDDLNLLIGRLNILKANIHTAIEPLRDELLDVLTDPGFDAFCKWRDAVDERDAITSKYNELNKKFADLSKQLEMERREHREQLKQKKQDCDSAIGVVHQSYAKKSRELEQKLEEARHLALEAHLSGEDG